MENVGVDSNTAMILVVDDDEGVRAVALETLGRAGYDVIGAASGEEAAQLLQESSFIAAVVDLVLPDCSGLDVLHRVRSANPDAVMVMVTGYASLDSAMEAVRLGAYDYIRKPFSPADLIHIVERGLKERQLAHRNRELLAELDRANRELTTYRDQLESRMQINAEKLDAFIELGKRLATSEGALPSIADVVDAAMQVAGASSGAVFIQGQDGGFNCVVSRGEAGADLHGVVIHGDEAAFRSVITTGEEAVISDLVTHDGDGSRDLSLLGLASAIVLPLRHQGLAHGLMALFDWKPKSFAKVHLNLLRVLCAQAAGLLARAHLQGPAAASPPPGGFIDIQDMLD